MSTSQFTRRQFISRSARLTASASIVGFWTERLIAASSSPNEKLNIAAIGTGNRGANNIYGVKGENIVALCDVDEQYLGRMHEQFPRARTYRDLRKLLDADHDLDLDAVLISTPDHTHAASALRAMRMGLHVYCEKPLAHSIAEVRALAEEAGRTRVATQMGNQHHSSDGYRRVVELVQSGVIGAVGEVHVWTDRPLWPQGIRRPETSEPVPAHLDWNLWLGPAPERPYDSLYHPFQWRGWWDFGCGALGDMGPHLIDPAFSALQLTHPTTIEADSAPVNQETAPEWSVVRFAFPARSGLPPVRLTWYDGGKRPPPSVTGTDDPPANGTLLIGERAKLFVPELGGQPLMIPRETRDRAERPEPAVPQPRGHYAEWLQACRDGSRTGSHFQYAARLTETCLLGNVAIRAGGKLEWDHEAMRVRNHPAANDFLSRSYRAGW